MATHSNTLAWKIQYPSKYIQDCNHERITGCYKKKLLGILEIKNMIRKMILLLLKNVYEDT